jgi:hypothetical protein
MNLQSRQFSYAMKSVGQAVVAWTRPHDDKLLIGRTPRRPRDCSGSSIGEGLPEFLLNQSLDKPEASLRMRQPPTERERTIARRRAEGGTFHRIGREFGLTPESVRSVCRRVEEFDRGAAILCDNPASIEAPRLVGEVNPSGQHTLRSRGINHLTDLEGVTLDQMLSWPKVGKQSATSLLEALARLKRTR